MFASHSLLKAHGICVQYRCLQFELKQRETNPGWIPDTAVCDHTAAAHKLIDDTDHLSYDKYVYFFYYKLNYMVRSHKLQ